MKLISGQLYQYLQRVQAYISPPIAAVFLIGVSLMTKEPSAGQLAGLTYSTKDREIKSKLNRNWLRKDIILTIILVLCVAMIWILFSG